MTTFYIVRHGETAWNANNRIQGHMDIELTEKGLEQARLAAERLRRERIDVVYSSDLKRASVTGDAIASVHGLDVIRTPLLREANLGHWQGLTIQEAADKYPDEHAAYIQDSIANRPLGAERLEELITRCKQFLSEAVAAHPGEHVAVAAHGGSVRGLIAAAFGFGPEIFRRVRMDNGSLTVIEIDANKLMLICLNDTCYLSGQGVGDGADQ